MYSDEEDEGVNKGTFEVYRAEGESLFKNGYHQKAISSFTEALEQRPLHKDCMVMRSRCQLALGNLDAAIKDVQTILDKDPKFHRALLQKGEVLYHMGEFEQSLVFFHRGHRLRPEQKDFKLGIQKAQEAIDNAVGSPDRVTLTKDGDLTYFDDQQTQSGTARRSAASKKNKRSAVSRQKSAGQSDANLKKLLGELYGDKKYLENLLKEIDDSTESGKDIQGLASEGVEYLNKRADFWRQQQPLGTRSSSTKKKTGGADGGTSRSSSALSAAGEPGKYILRQLELIDKEQSEGMFPESLKRCRRCLKQVDSYPKGTLNNKTEVVSHIQSCMGNAYLEMGQPGQAITHYQKDLEASKNIKDEAGQARAIGNLGRAQARQGQYKEAIDSWQKALRLSSENMLDVMWLQHEIGRCHLELGQLNEAESAGEEALKAAKEANDEMWQINTTVLIAQCQVKLGRLQDGLDSFNASLKLAKEQKDEPAQRAIQTAIDETKKKLEGEGQDSDNQLGDGEDAQGEDTAEQSQDVSEETKVDEKKSQAPVEKKTKEPSSKDSTPVSNDRQTQPQTKSPTNEKSNAKSSSKQPTDAKKGDSSDASKSKSNDDNMETVVIKAKGKSKREEKEKEPETNKEVPEVEQQNEDAEPTNIDEVTPTQVDEQENVSADENQNDDLEEDQADDGDE